MAKMTYQEAAYGLLPSKQWRTLLLSYTDLLLEQVHSYFGVNNTEHHHCFVGVSKTISAPSADLMAVF